MAILELFKNRDGNIIVQKVSDGYLQGMRFENGYLKTLLKCKINTFVLIINFGEQLFS